jgi:ABC-type phosphate transport system permease subunit
MYPNPFYAQRAPAQPGNGVAVAGLVLGITSIVFCWWGLLTLAQIMLAVIFSSVGISKANHGAANKGLAVAGLVLALVGLVLYFFIGLFSLGIGWVI